MSQGINLEQFKNKLDTDAQQRCLNQEKTIKELNFTIKTQGKTIKDLNGIIEREEDSIRILQNRCKALSNGVFCDRCGMRNICKSQDGLNMGDGTSNQIYVV